jgi:hypothetical protein
LLVRYIGGFRQLAKQAEAVIGRVWKFADSLAAHLAVLPTIGNGAAAGQKAERKEKERGTHGGNPQKSGPRQKGPHSGHILSGSVN